MKKILSFVLAISLVLGACLSLASCTESADFTVGICQLTPHVALDSATQGFMDALEAELAKEGKTVKFKYQDAGNDIRTGEWRTGDRWLWLGKPETGAWRTRGQG